MTDTYWAQGLSSASVLDYPYSLNDLLVGWPDFVIDFDKAPAHHASLVDNVSRWMRQASARGIEQPIPVDDLVSGIRQKRELG